MTERVLTKPQIISELTKSPHGNLESYVPMGQRAAVEDADFFGHLVAWNHQRGQIRDAKVALPMLALAGATTGPMIDNALAHVADLNPRMFDKALGFARTLKAPSRLMRRLVERYLRDLELAPREWERTAIQHRQTLKGLYARYHIKPVGMADAALFKGVGAGKFAILRGLSALAPQEIAGTIEAHKIPFMVARGALGEKAKHPDVVLALMARMSPTELVTNTKALERLGVKTVPALRAAFEAAIERAGTSKRAKATLKTTRAAEAIADDEKLSGKLRALQEKQLDTLRGIEGDWLVLGDKSGSMEATIELAREVAAVLTRMIKGRVHLVFFDSSPRYLEITGHTLEALKLATATVTAGGNTSIGCGLQYALDRKLEVDGIAIVSDGCENATPIFATVYQSYAKRLDREPTVYWYQTSTVGIIAQKPVHVPQWQWDQAVQQYPAQSAREIAGFTGSCERAGIDVQRFDLTSGADYYSLPNLVQTMRVGRYQLLDEVLATPLRTLDEVLDRTKGMKVWHVAGLETARRGSIAVG